MTPEEEKRVQQLQWAQEGERLRIALYLLERVLPLNYLEKAELDGAKRHIAQLMAIRDQA